ncbi:apolipoprotein M-like [Carassius auratus]|uniref:Apolipoprotein M n=1 Tax=Carassius auratus TaxID=7957 RepID=A0A6P6RJ17_CARAU|nr:apolipoprotein M-like [Carassius auratus]XP_026146406.1 apolipoprotein M-like [Carassius auratus]XP_052387566.1 apolipoprotein M [Carassius gibelio]XP_052387575.1 apolipoprotein M [Carassius gibelio]
MLMNTLWGVVGSVMGLLYTGIQVMVPCLPPAPLSNDVISTDVYMGTWHFVAAAAWDEDDLKSFKTTDSSVLHIQKGTNGTLTATEGYRVGDKCQKNTWSYYISSVTEPFLFRTDFDAFVLIWDGKFVNCPSCIIIFLVDENEEASALLFARNEVTPDEVIQEFESKMECVLMDDVIKAPLKKGYCKLDEAA